MLYEIFPSLIVVCCIAILLLSSERSHRENISLEMWTAAIKEHKAKRTKRQKRRASETTLQTKISPLYNVYNLQCFSFFFLQATFYTLLKEIRKAWGTKKERQQPAGSARKIWNKMIFYHHFCLLTATFHVFIHSIKKSFCRWAEVGSMRKFISIVINEKLC